MSKRKYDASSIQVLEDDRDQVRKRPTIFIPSKDAEGAMHLIYEIIDNAIDELSVKETVGDHIITTYDESTHMVTVTDNGAGIPQAKLLDVCTKLYSSGKFDNGEGTAYLVSGGLNGVGLTATVYLSEIAEVSSMQKGKKLTYKFKDGFLKDTVEEKCKDHGTIVKFKIDNDIVRINDLVTKDLVDRYEEKSYRFPKIKMSLTILNKGKTKKKYEFYGKTIVDRIEMMKPDTEILYGKDTKKVSVLKHVSDDTLTETKVGVEFAFTFKEEAVEDDDVYKYCIAYGNTIKNYKLGAHFNGLKDGIIKFFREDLQQTLNKRDRELQFIPSDICSGLCAFVIAEVTEPEFRGQYKDELLNPEARRAVRDVVYDTLKDSKPSFQKKMGEFIVRVARGRLESKKARTKSKDVANSFSKDRIKKYWPIIRTANTFESELILVEGPRK